MHGEEKQLDARVGAGLRAELTVCPHEVQGLGTASSSSISRLYYALVPAITIASDAHARQLLSMWPLTMHLDGSWHDVSIHCNAQTPARAYTQQSERACCRRTGATHTEINCQREEGANE